MVNGENRAKIKEGATAITRGMKRVTIGVAEKIQTCIDAAVVQPTMRAVDFDSDSHHKDMMKSDAHFHAKVKKAQAGNKFMKVVFAQPVQSGLFEAKTYPKSDEDIALIDAALDDNFVFSKLPASKRTGLIDAFEPIIVKAGTKIIEEGEDGDYFYVVGSGIVDIEIDGKVIGTAEEGSSFGELALLYQAPRAATCIAKTMCGLFRLDQETFKRTMAQQVRESQADVMGILKSVPYFKDLGEKYINRIASHLRVINYKSGDFLVSREEDTPRRFYILKSGNALIQGIQLGGSFYNQIALGPNEYFGEIAMLTNQWSCETVLAKGDVVALVLDRDDFMEILGDDFAAIAKLTLDKKALAHIPFGKRKNPVDENELDLLAGAIVEKSYKKGHVFFTEGARCTPSLYLIREGKVSIQSAKYDNLDAVLGLKLSGTGKIKTIEKLGFFGNDTMGANEAGELGVAQYTVIALEDIEVGLLDFNAIKAVFAAEKESKIGLDDLNMVRILGAGTFGKVWLVSHKSSKDTYALKVQVKHFLIKNNQADGVIREKNIMVKLDHPFLIKMISHWKDDDKLYMLLKLYQGGELNSVIHTATRDGIPERAARFYAANILEGLSYMHRRHIIYRDLKPANVMLDADGYTVIVDFGFAKIIKDRTYTFCGTPLYLAPEIIVQDGHNAGADHWAWGVMLYEMIVGMTPFYDGIVDQMGLFKNIVKGKFDFPEGDFVSLTAKDLITRMLTTDPKERLGSFAGAEKDIKTHPFFEGFDWENLLKKNVRVPFKPKISDPLDGSNFDDFSKLEAKAKTERYPKLTGAEQRMFQKF